MESIAREHQLMDECSCIDFSRKFKQHEEGRSSAVIDTVRESWRKLRDRHADLRHLVAAEHKYSPGIIRLACGMSNLISEAELLHTKILLDCQWFFLRNQKHPAGLNMGHKSSGDLIWEMLSTATKMKVSSSLGQNINTKTLNVGLGAEMALPENGPVTNSEQKLHYTNIIQSVVPSRAYMTIKGDAFYEYLSSLGHISRSESSRLSEGDGKNKRRRGRAARNYLSTGSLMLSPEEISLLGQSNMYGKISYQSLDTNIR
ncbi:hypothetical protein GH714_023675 [Hevea brasiliensis]|uniref:Uncharacterized protein n=1 Tax=Hevea brasiliensis TaxID=3981 RepID=A0A6A6KQW2_HEVBR|nr:hypothetical protein GH714_023675 [Hevea brasiliensis]